MSAALGFAPLASGHVTCSVAAILFVLLASLDRASARRLIVLVIAGYTCMSIYGIGHRFVAALSSSYKPLAAEDVPQGPTAVVVLGLGGLHDPRLGRGTSFQHPMPTPRAVRSRPRASTGSSTLPT